MKKKEILSPILLCISACILVVITVLGNNQTVYAQGNEGWSYDESTHTLSLMNYTYRDAVNEDDNIVQIYADGDLKQVEQWPRISGLVTIICKQMALWLQINGLESTM